MKILVTGGAGYIGSFMVKRLLEEGHVVSVVDSLERGHEEVVSKNAELIKGDLKNKSFVARLFPGKDFEAIIHFAAYISMGESMENPYLYFDNNVIGSLNLIEEAALSGVKKIIFSSTAGVYGDPELTPIPEDHSKNPTNPYGESKLMVERVLNWYAKTKGLNFTALRYFNACGAALDGSMGEMHSPETHLIPSAIDALSNNKELRLFGTDYDTKDGTAVRDYIHVLDLVEAHLLALEKINGANYYNVGTGNGYSNREVIEKIINVSGKKLNLVESPRRPGDASILIADVSKIKTDLGFNPKHSDLDTIVKTAWSWHSSRI